jgi:hypothetical protein
MKSQLSSNNSRPGGAGNAKPPKPILEQSALLEFADVMENLSSLKEIDIVPKEFVDFMKEDKTKVHNLVEYSTGLVAIMDGALLVFFESIEKYYKKCVAVLAQFRDSTMPHVSQEWRDQLTDYKTLKGPLLKKIGETHLSPSHLYGFESLLDLKSETQIADLSSKILLCFNGELTSSYNTRIDLVLLGHITDFDKELKTLVLIHNRFKKSSVAWHYRNIVFRCGFSQAIERVLYKLTQTISQKPAAQNTSPQIWKQEDFAPIVSFWADEMNRLDGVINKHGRSYKIWEYLIHISNYIYSVLTKGEFFVAYTNLLKQAPETLQTSFTTELEILLIQGFTKRFDETKVLARKNVHNHCIFVLMAHYLKTLFALEVDKFLENDNFYEELVDAHLNWTEEVKNFYSMLYSVESANAQVTTLSLLEQDRRKLESINSHRAEVEYLRLQHRAKHGPQAAPQLSKPTVASGTKGQKSK